MIPEKLYIPTSTLNFNNIMSSESISPAKFYEERDFGYKRFTKVEPNHLDYSICLYEESPAFDVDDKELDNFPMIIEIDTESINKNIIKEKEYGVYIAEETIYFNLTTKIIFRNDQEKNSTLSKAKPSIETKMVELYRNRNRFIVDSHIKKVKKTVNIDDIQRNILGNILHDKEIDKVKGFLYAYLLAANKSMSAKITTLKRCSKELKNVLSAIITSPNGKPTTQQNEQLDKIFEEFNNAIKKLEDKNQITKELKNILSAIITSNGKPTTQQNEQLDKIFDNTIKKLEDKNPKAKIQALQLPKISNNQIETLPTEDEKKKDFPSKLLLNKYLSKASNGEEFIQARYDFAFAGGKIFKKELGDKWENSDFQKYINSLLMNLKDYTSFDIQSLNDLTLKSFAAFCQKGDDIDKLEDYLIANNISDFRIAFGLWGVTFGFANMPKTLTNDFFLSDDINYISEIYKYIYKQVHEIELKGVVGKTGKAKDPTIISKESQPKTFEPNTGNEVPDKSKNLQTKELYEKLKEKCPSVKRDEVKYIQYLTEYGITPQLIEIIKNDKQLYNGRGVPEKVIRFLKEEINHQPSFWEDSLALKEFYSDNDAFSRIEYILPNDKEIREQFKEDLDWFQNNYNETYIDKKKAVALSGKYFNYSKDNVSVIKRYEDFLQYRKNSKQESMEWLRLIYAQVDIDQIISKLKELYLKDE